MANCVHFMYAMSGFAEELIFQNWIYVTKNSVQYMYEMS